MTGNKRFKRICSRLAYPYCIDKRNNDKRLTEADMLDLLNELYKENQELKAQLLQGDGVCDICKHECLVKKGKYYVSECKKGHEECSTIDLAYCGDFELKEELE